jgi:hypothetical protein
MPAPTGAAFLRERAARAIERRDSITAGRLLAALDQALNGPPPDERRLQRCVCGVRGKQSGRIGTFYPISGTRKGRSVQKRRCDWGGSSGGSSITRS